MDSIEQSLDEFFLEKNSKGTQILEIEYLKSDIERLLTLLRSTKEYKEFSSFAQDSQNIRYLKKMPHLITDSQKSKVNFCHPHKGQFQIIEKLLWVPADAFEHFNQIREKYQVSFPEQVTEEILLGLNQIFLNRE